jgi:alpha-1,3-rhamnosyl/mannosyltransferase
MAAGTPTLVADTPALLEVAGDAAVVFGPDDLDGATAAIDRVLRDRQHADALRQAGRDRIRGFSWHRTASMTATAYHQGAMQA